MKFSQVVVSGALALVAVLALAEARYNSAPAYPAPAYPAPAAYGAPKAHGQSAPANYGGYAQAQSQSGYSSRQRSPYGPYHSYKVKPALYGGRGLYHYMGYARHYPARPTPTHYRAVRSYKPAKAHYGLRPVKALVLAPAYNANSAGSGYSSANSGYSGASSARYNGGASASNGYRQKRAQQSAYQANQAYPAASAYQQSAHQQSAYQQPAYPSYNRHAQTASNYNRGASYNSY